MLSRSSRRKSLVLRTKKKNMDCANSKLDKKMRLLNLLFLTVV